MFLTRLQYYLSISDTMRLMAPKVLFFLLAFSLLTFADLPFLEERGITSGEYIAPNEFSPNAYNAALNGREGVLIGVGSFRVLEDAEKGDFDKVFLIDYDRRLVEFNKLNVELLKTSKSRFDYIRRLFSVSEEDPSFKSLKSGRINLKKFISLFDGYKGDSQYQGSRPRLSNASKEEEALRKLLNKSVRRFSNTIRESIAEALKDSKDMFIYSDTKFARLQKLAKKNTFEPLVGDWAGKSTLQSIAENLNGNGQRVSVIDLSNLLEYFIQDPKDFHRFLSNAEKLPRTPDAVVLMSMYGGGPHVKKNQSKNDAFTYATANANEFFQELHEWLAKEDILKERRGSEMLFQKINNLWESLYKNGTIRFHNASGRISYFNCKKILPKLNQKK